MRAALPPMLLSISALSLAALPLVGCAGRDRLADDSTGTMLTSVPQQEVAECIARQVGGSVEPAGDGQVHITAASQPSVSFNVGPNPKDTVNTTRVIVRGFTENSGLGARAATCIIDQRRLPAKS